MPATSGSRSNHPPRASRGTGRPPRRRSRSSGGGNKGAIGGVVTAVVVLVLIGIKVAAGLPSWRTLEAETTRIGSEDIFLYELTMPRGADIELTATEQDGKPLTVTWLSQSQFDRLEAGMYDAGLQATMDQHARVNRGQLAQASSKPLPSGRNVILIMSGGYQDETAPPVVVDYQVRVHD